MTGFIAIIIIAAVALTAFLGLVIGFVVGYNLPRIKEWREAMRGWGGRE